MNEPIQYREYIIEQYNGFPHYMYKHEEFTGGEDKRCGSAATLDAAKSDIDNMTIEEQEHQISILRKKVADLELALEVERRFTRSCRKKIYELKKGE